MGDTTYNGWTNYETWDVKLWLDNDYQTYSYVQDMIASLDMDEEYPALTLADALRDLVMEEMRPEADASMFEDILTAGLERVDWREIADNLLSERVS